MDKLVDTGSQAGTYGGGAVAVYYGWFNVHEWAAITGAVIALLSFVVHLWYTVQRNRRAEEAHRIEMENLRAGKTSVAVRTEADGSDSP